MTASFDNFDVTLTGSVVELVPLSMDHLEGLIEATRDGDMSDRWYTSIPGPGGVRDMIETRLRLKSDKSMIPFTTIRRTDGAVIGSTTFYDIRPQVPRMSIGYTWNRQSAHGSGTNAESKLLLMSYAFEELDCAAIRFETSWANKQSQAAIERLGARKDGVLRADGRESNGVLRDTVVYSLMAHEWPSAKAGLVYRVGKGRG